MHLGKKTLQELKDKKISIEDLNDQYFDAGGDAEIENVLKLLNENICSFQDLVDKYTSIRNKYNALCLYVLLGTKKLFEELVKNNIMTKRDLKYLLNTIDKYHELHYLCVNTPLTKYLLNEFVLNREIVDRFSTILENANVRYNDTNMHTIFDLIEFNATYYWDSDESEYCKKSEIDQELFKLNELNKYMYSFDLSIDQQLELIELIKNNEIAKNRLIQIVENHLESNYDFESLMSCLKKIEKKNLMNI